MVWRGMYEDALFVLSSQPSSFNTTDNAIQNRTLQGTAFTRLHQFTTADESLKEAERLCKSVMCAACGGVPRARGFLAMEQGQFTEARRSYLESLRFARLHD